MPTKIKPDYKPSDRVYQLLTPFLGSDERAREFVGHELGAFMMYWEGRDDAGAAKSNWDSTCLNWMKRTYEDKKERLALYRPASTNQGNVFELAMKEVEGQAPADTGIEMRPLKIVNKPIPGEGQTMSAADALDLLAKMR